MPVVFVHGNPETSAVWGPLLEELDRYHVICLSPPGFGAPVPPGWKASILNYRDWLIAELERIGEAVDLVGHDWGGGHVLNVAMARPDLLRSWCSDLLGCFDTDYKWHPDARVWQTADTGEAAVAALVADPWSKLASLVQQRGLPDVIARHFAEHIDEVMGDCILRLYRSAAQPTMANLGADLSLASARPGLAVIAEADHNVGDIEMRARAAARAGAQVARLDGLDHWWMAENPRRAADVLRVFWHSVS
ncbi:alpha/beta hydrolase [Pseudonocardia xishanensis]|uniref:Alpha/beta fold hydrolase n=1 Tax=Pseudonocardia xishanensis TaxID=630995 RepID=A0ABP8RWI9_9PSEU